jgi:DNA-binding NarL/FixJ family response regulator
MNSSEPPEKFEGERYPLIWLTLSRRQRQVLCLVASGLEDKQIAHIMGVCKRTVKDHAVRARRKIGVYNRVLMTRWAMRYIPDIVAEYDALPAVIAGIRCRRGSE